MFALEQSHHAISMLASQDAMSPAQREAYEETKLKMRKAIADPDLVDETEQASDKI